LKVLVDTHVLVWLVTEPERIDSVSLQKLGDSTNEVVVSLVSAWELAIKQATKKVVLSKPANEWFAEYTERCRMVALGIDLASIGRTLELPMHHRDPFDRLLVAQALVHGLVLCTRDERLGAYGALMLKA
jgi:PIN domain nuclease of toxin-antitoxin system